jgi:L-amino acid N-acyltransferase YncA
MRRQVTVAIVGDYSSNFPPHVKTGEALQHAQAALGIRVEADWIPTADLDEHATKLSHYDAVLVAPGAPYKSMTGALNAIRHCRETGLPLLGTCGGCQHVAIEFAHNVLGISDDSHAKSDPYASKLIITPLSCSLKGLTMEVQIEPGSQVERLYGATRAIEQYYCNFGLNPEYQGKLHEAGLRIVGSDTSGEARILSLDGHPFFVATLFVPQLTSAPDKPHPIILGFLHAAAAQPISTLRGATEYDLPAILAIYNEVIASSTAVYALEPVTLDERRSWFASRSDAGFPVLVAVDSVGDVLGFASFGDWRGAWPGYRYTIEHSVHVRHDVRGQGIGRTLVESLFPLALALGRHVMIGGIDAANDASIRFHERLGFERVAHFKEVGHKFGRWLDLVFMQRFLDPPGSIRP